MRYRASYVIPAKPARSGRIQPLNFARSAQYVQFQQVKQIPEKPPRHPPAQAQLVACEYSLIFGLALTKSCSNQLDTFTISTKISMTNPRGGAEVDQCLVLIDPDFQVIDETEQS